ncbi:MAG: type 4a pilus biogenesis protein PilO [Candidatus Omnitrophota bacterium]
MKIDIGLIIEKFNQLDAKIRYAAFAGILLVIFLVDFFTLIGFQWGSLEKIYTENQALQQNIERLKSDIHGIDQMKAGLQQSRKQLEAMNMKIHAVTDKDAILEDVSRIANEADVKIEQLTPQIESQQALVSSGALKYYALPIVIQASSGYHTFGHFINQLEQAKLFFTISSLTMEDRGGDSHRHSINTTFKVVLSDKNTGDQKK